MSCEHCADAYNEGVEAMMPEVERLRAALFEVRPFVNERLLAIVDTALHHNGTPPRQGVEIARLRSEVERLRKDLTRLAKAAVCPHGCRMCEHYEPIAIEALRSLGL